MNSRDFQLCCREKSPYRGKEHVGMSGSAAKVETLPLVQPEQTHLYIFLHLLYLCSGSFREKPHSFKKKSLHITHKYENISQTIRYYAKIDIDFSTRYAQRE